MDLHRRSLLRAGALLPLIPVVPALTACTQEAGPASGTPRPLPVPELLEPEMDGEVATFTLTAQAGTSEFVPGTTTATWGFNGAYLGPTLLLRRGQPVRVNVRNELPETTTVHWHGIKLPAAADGGPHQPIEPGQSWSAEFTPDQPAMTGWYHPHPHGNTAQQVYRGLAGLLWLQDDDDAAEAGIPSEYGVDDVPLVVQDKRLAEDGELMDAAFGTNVGVLGQTVVVNGQVNPLFEAERELIRFRLVNGSNTRVYGFRFADGRTFAQIASDGGLLAEPFLTDAVHLSPGERAEIVVRFVPGETAQLISAEPRMGSVADPDDVGARDELAILTITGPPAAADAGDQQDADADRTVPAVTAPEDLGLPAVLAEVPRHRVDDAAETRQFRLQGFQINSRAMSMSRIDFAAPVDQLELWQVVNMDPIPHNFHIHNAQFQVHDVDGAGPPPDLAGWKDTVYVEPQRTTRLLVRFERYTDPEVPYMYHCHLLYHEDEGMMGQFTVVDGPGSGEPSAFESPAPDGRRGYGPHSGAAHSGH